MHQMLLVRLLKLHILTYKSAQGKNRESLLNSLVHDFSSISGMNVMAELFSEVKQLVLAVSRSTLKKPENNRGESRDVSPFHIIKEIVKNALRRSRFFT